MSHQSASPAVVVLTAALIFVGSMLLVLAVVAVQAVLLMWCWNFLLVGEESIFATSFPELSFWKAFALLFLANLLFKSGYSSRSKNR